MNIEKIFQILRNIQIDVLYFIFTGIQVILNL